MYFKITTSKSNKYLQLVKSYRNQQGNPRQKVIANLGNISSCSEQELLNLCKSFLRALGVEKIVFLDDLTVEDSYDYGDVLPIISLWQQLKLDAIIQRCVSKHVQIDVTRATLLMVCNKFVDPQSKLGAWRWYDRSVLRFSKEFKHLPPGDKAVLQDLYRSLDYLSDSKTKIEKELYYQLQAYGLETELVLYDITSSYFEGEQAELGAYGYSRDHRPDRPQIVIGVVTSKQGIPFAHYVFEGNTSDKSTVKQVLSDLKKRFGITHCVFVGDRGMISRINIECIKDQEYDFIMGIRRHNSRLVRELLPFIKEAPEAEILEIKPEQLSEEKLRQEFRAQTRFIIGFNPAVQQKVRQNRNRKLAEFEAFISRLPLEGPLKVVSENQTKVVKCLIQKKLKRYYTLSLNPAPETDNSYRLQITPNEEVLNQETLIDGHYFIQTEVKELLLESNEVIAAYKSLQKVERMFRVLKNNIELRPIFVRNEKRIRGHIFICFLTYLLECLMEKTLAEYGSEISLSHIKPVLARIKLVPVNLSNRITSQNRQLYFVTNANAEVQKFFTALKIRNFRHPENIYFDKKLGGTGNFSNQLSLFSLFSMS